MGDLTVQEQHLVEHLLAQVRLIVQEELEWKAAPQEEPPVVTPVEVVSEGDVDA